MIKYIFACARHVNITSNDRLTVDLVMLMRKYSLQHRVPTKQSRLYLNINE